MTEQKLQTANGLRADIDILEQEVREWEGIRNQSQLLDKLRNHRFSQTSPPGANSYNSETERLTVDIDDLIGFNDAKADGIQILKGRIAQKKAQFSKL